MPLYDDLKTQIDKVIEAAKAATADKQLTLAEVTTIGMEVFHTIALLANELPNTPDADKKALLLQVADEFYKSVIGPMDIPGVPDFIENRFVDPILGNVFHKVAEGVIDWILMKTGGK